MGSTSSLLARTRNLPIGREESGWSIYPGPQGLISPPSPPKTAEHVAVAALQLVPALKAKGLSRCGPADKRAGQGSLIMTKWQSVRSESSETPSSGSPASQ